MNTLSAHDIKQRLDQGERLQLIDVRSPGEFAAGHIPCAVNMPMQEVEARLNDMNAKDPVVLICQGGTRASMVCEQIQDKRSDLTVLEGGTDAWVSEGLPVITSTATRWSLERQVRLMAGILILTGTILSLTVNSGWVFLAMFVGAGLTFAGLTNICGMSLLFALMPWNKARPSSGTPDTKATQTP